MTVREHAIKGIDSAQRYGVANHKQVIGSVGEAVVVLVGVVGCLLVLGCRVFGLLVKDFGTLAAQRGSFGHKD